MATSELATAAIAKAVQHIYSHNHNSNEEYNVSTVKSIFTSLPVSFFPILITSLWFLPVNLLAYFILSLPFSLLSSPASPKTNPQLLESFHQGLCFVAFLFLDSWFRLSLQVAVLEPARCGVGALKRSGKLVKSKVHTALALLAVFLVFYFAHVGMLEVVWGIPVDEEWPIWVMYPLAAAVSVVYVAFMAYWLVVMSVFYFVSEGKCGGEEELVCEGNAYQPLDVGSG